MIRSKTEFIKKENIRVNITLLKIVSNLSFFFLCFKLLCYTIKYKRPTNISTFVGYLMPNPFYINNQFYFKQ